jgi:predicted nucleic acid-binding protein
MKNYIVDASVIIKWILGDEREPDHNIAMSLLNSWYEGHAEISAPTLWQYEVGNFLGRALNDEAPEKIRILLDLNIKSIEITDKMFRQCFLWMKENSVTFYDAAYLATAVELGGVLITADEKFVNKMKKAKSICLLRDLKIYE